MTTTTEQRLKAVLASYGADPARWPAAERAELEAHLANVRGEMEDARLIDRLLDLAPATPMGQESAVMARLGRPSASLPGWAVALPLAASLALGIYLGAMGDLDSILPPLSDDVASADDDGADFSGVTEATDYSEEQLS